MDVADLPIKMQQNIRVESTGFVSPCWVWVGGRNGLGYGELYVPGQKHRPRTHRLAYNLAVGEIPEGLEIDHLCRVRACCNPEHLEAVTHAVNMARRMPYGRTHCFKGHPLTPDNVYVGANGRQCRTCRREASRRRKQRIRALRTAA